MAGVGRRVRLVAIGGGQKGAHRLTELGLTPGVEVEVLRDDGGAVLIALRDTRLMLSRGLAHHVQVVPL
jgi:ferrous iron transport protein A